MRRPELAALLMEFGEEMRLLDVVLKLDAARPFEISDEVIDEAGFMQYLFGTISPAALPFS